MIHDQIVALSSFHCNTALLQLCLRRVASEMCVAKTLTAMVVPVQSATALSVRLSIQHIAYRLPASITNPTHSCCRDADQIDSLDRYSMACPALPLCGLAIGEAERGLPDINNRIRALMDKLGFGPDEHFHIRMTGCPNGCTRPYMAELGFVGDGPNSYQLWLGGTAAQTRLAEPFMERMKVQVGDPACISRFCLQS